MADECFPPSRYFIFLSDTSKKSLQAEMDEFSDSYFWDLDLADIKQVNLT